MSTGKSRKIQYNTAINEALFQIMSVDKNVILIGQGVTSPWYVGNTTQGLLEKFGAARVIDTPVSENALTGVAVGAALAGMKPVVVYPRMDFMLYAFDPIINEAANWNYMFGGKASVPVVFWAIISRGGEQAAQHSQALQAMFMHIPGLKVVMPSNPYDAKGLLISAIRDGNPVMYIYDRWLHDLEFAVPSRIYSVPIGKGVIKKPGKDATIVATSYMVTKSITAAQILHREGIEAEVIDLRTIKPVDQEIIFRSVRKTGRLIVADAGWKTCGVAAEISALAAEKVFPSLRAPIKRVTLPDAPAPSSGALEKLYYPEEKDIVKAVRELIRA